MQEHAKPPVKKPYIEPEIVHTETLTSRAVVCAKADVFCESLGGPIQS